MTMDNTKIRKTTGQIIREKRKSLNLSVDELANALDVTPSGLSHVERGKRFLSPGKLLELSIIFQCTIDELYGIRESAPAPFDSYVAVFVRNLRLYGFDNQEGIELLNGIIQLLCGWKGQP